MYSVATVLTACGIETEKLTRYGLLSPELQQYLPLAVLKLEPTAVEVSLNATLQQYLPLAVLKPTSP